MFAVPHRNSPSSSQLAGLMDQCAETWIPVNSSAPSGLTWGDQGNTYLRSWNTIGKDLLSCLKNNVFWSMMENDLVKYNKDKPKHWFWKKCHALFHQLYLLFLKAEKKEQRQRNFWGLQDVHINEGSLFFLLKKKTPNPPGNEHGSKIIYCQRAAKWRRCKRESEQTGEPKTHFFYISQPKSLLPCLFRGSRNYLITAVLLLCTHTSLHTWGQQGAGSNVCATKDDQELLYSFVVWFAFGNAIFCWGLETLLRSMMLCIHCSCYPCHLHEAV